MRKPARRQVLSRKQPLLLPGVYDAMSARLVGPLLEARFSAGVTGREKIQSDQW
jgi:hypothetical protein